MGTHRVMIVGASGYSGGVLARLLVAHPDFELAIATSDALAGKKARSLGIDSDVSFVKHAEGFSALASSDVDVVFLATPAEVSASHGPGLLEGPGGKKRTVIDLSGAFRLATADDMRAHYKLDHPAKELLGKTHYGLPELFGAPERGTLVANPGCYPTATLLALAPLVKAGLAEAEGIVVDAKSGTTGAGRQSKEEHSFAEVAENLRAYKVLAHQHEPEIVQKLGMFSGHASSDLVFTPHLLPVRRGLMATCYLRAKPGVDAEAVSKAYREAYEGKSFVELASADDVSLAQVVGTNTCRIGFAVRSGRIVVVSVIDNLLKGAAGQALQNANLALGLPETRGLDRLQRSAA